MRVGDGRVSILYHKSFVIPSMQLLLTNYHSYRILVNGDVVIVEAHVLLSYCFVLTVVKSNTNILVQNTSFV